jgi:hypothetical protein
MNPSLWAGFTGVAWAAELVDLLLDPDAEDGNEAVDDAVLRLLSRDDLQSLPYDLVVGLTGLGVYALQRCPRPVAVRCLHRVLDWLDQRAGHDEHGLFWWTPREEILSDEGRRDYPSGRGDLGVAHGVAGPIALLGTICGTGVERARARRLLEGSVHWLLAQAMATDTGPTFPLWSAPGFRPYPARSAWCYGDPGIAAALLIAARGAGNAGWEKEALDLACRAAARPPLATGVVDASMCHGSAGLAHIYNRMYQATGAPELGRAAASWVQRTLDFYRSARASGGPWVHGSRDPARLEPWTGIDVVDGAAGVALVLLAAATPVEPVWDRMFLLSGPGARSDASHD